MNPIIQAFRYAYVQSAIDLTPYFERYAAARPERLRDVEASASALDDASVTLTYENGSTVHGDVTVDEYHERTVRLSKRATAPYPDVPLAAAADLIGAIGQVLVDPEWM